ncbi:MAG: AMP-binding protein [Actinomycetota bacterium]
MIDEFGSLWDLIERRALETPDGPTAVDERGGSLTFAGLREGAERVAAGLAANHGIGEGDVVSWQLPTWTESMVLVGALSRLQAVQNPILPLYRQREVGFIVPQARTKLFLTPSTWRGFDYEAMVREIAQSAGGVEVLVADRTLPEGDPASLPPRPSARGPDDAPVRWLFYTSGTTAEPKGAKHTDHTIAAAARGMVERLALVPEDRSALVFPFTHVGGIIWLYAGLMTGLVNVIDEAFDPEKTTEYLAKQDVTLAGSGTFFHLAYLKMQQADPSRKLFPNVRAYPGGGAPKPPQLHYDLKEHLGGAGIVSGYGLTEAPIISMAGVDDTDEVLANTEGRATPGVELRAVTLEGNEAGVGEEGEIRAKGPQLMRGYVDSSLDAEAFDEDGWFRTGDLGTLDGAGNVTITGRLKDIIIRKGENISAKELEDALFTHPKVADVAVVGLPDPESGEIACAVVASKRPEDPLSFEEMQAFLEEQTVTKRKWPERLESVEALPRNPAGKVLKQDLRKQFGDG